MQNRLRAVFEKKTVKKLIRIALCALTLACVLLIATNATVLLGTSDKILTQEEAAELTDVDCILVLGCLVRSDGTPSDMLHDRLERAVELYAASVAPKLLMSGDHGQIEYDEVNSMKRYALECGVDSVDIFMDHAGFSTYESMYRAKEIFGADKIVIVTQGYHLPRAIYIARSLGIEAYGVASDQREYRGQAVRDAREALAVTKDFAYTIIKPLPTYLGEPISLLGDGNVTNG